MLDMLYSVYRTITTPSPSTGEQKVIASVSTLHFTDEKEEPVLVLRISVMTFVMRKVKNS